MSFFIYNGKFFEENTPVITPDNHSFRYGNGLFETLKFSFGKLFLKQFHFERLFTGLDLLHFDIPQNFTPQFLENEILKLLEKNNHLNTARIRLTLFKGNGQFNSSESDIPNYIIQSWEIDRDTGLNAKGFKIDIYKDVKKSCDVLSNIKTNNFLPYLLVAQHAKKNKFDDCILLNTNGRVCDTSVANIFIIKNKKIYTPSLSEGCIAGVMRKFLLHNIIGKNGIIEKPISIEDLKQANEIFLTNSIYPIRWVNQFQNIQYSNQQIQILSSIVLKLLNE